MVARHNAIRDALARLARDSGADADIEVDVAGAAADPLTGARLDVQIRRPTGGERNILVDVSVTTLFAAGATGRPGAAASLVAGAKRRKYGNITVTPAILETFGRAGEALSSLIRRLAPEDLGERTLWIGHAWRIVSTHLQAHNARMVRKAINGPSG